MIAKADMFKVEICLFLVEAAAPVELDKRRAIFKVACTGHLNERISIGWVLWLSQEAVCFSCFGRIRIIREWNS